MLRAALWHHWADRQRADRSAASAGRVIGTVLAVLGVAEVLLTRDLVGGLWLVLLGWFMTSAAAAEQGAAAARALLADLRVADVMTPDPDLAAAWLTRRGAHPPTRRAAPDGARAHGAASFPHRRHSRSSDPAAG